MNLNCLRLFKIHQNLIKKYFLLEVTQIEEIGGIVFTRNCKKEVNLTIINHK